MTTAAGLPAVRESLHLAALDAPGGSPVVVDLLSGLLGNLAFHLGDHAGARAHLTVAAALGPGELRALKVPGGVVPAGTGEHAGRAAAPSDQLGVTGAVSTTQPSLAALARAADADQALADSACELEADQVGWSPGRFGFDSAEHRLHAAEAQLVLGRHDQAAAYATTSIDACIPETPGWAAATAVLAQAEAPREPRRRGPARARRPRPHPRRSSAFHHPGSAHRTRPHVVRHRRCARGRPA